MKFTPLKDWMILELVTPYKGIMLPDTDKGSIPDELNSFRVVEIGPDVKTVKVGDTIVPYFNPIQAHRHEDQTIFLFKEEFVSAVGH